MGLYFEDFTVGHSYTSPGRTITEADVVAFAGLSGDYHELHTNAEYARQSGFGQRIAHGALIFSISIGLTTRMSLMDGTVVALGGIDKLRFTKPVLIGDTIQVRKDVLLAREMDAQRGLITFQTTVTNQGNESVLVYQDKILIKRRTA